MKIDSVELTDEEVYAIENNEEINEGTYPPTYDTQWEVLLEYQLECMLEGTGEIRYYIDRVETAEKDIQGLKALIIKSIGKKSYNNILELFDRYKLRLYRDHKELWKSHDELYAYVYNTFK
ncbi:MAG TPA: hypothetical protein PLQ82_16305 [Desulfobacteraceae bacterium]|nr:hypothetical protein [Desulfobacteraceae bacterium]